jgi:hypothetical protein
LAACNTDEGCDDARWFVPAGLAALVAYMAVLAAGEPASSGARSAALYHLQVGDGTASFGAGAAFPEHVRMEQDWDTAVAVATGTMNAQDAFIGGRIRLTGDQQKLIEAQPVFKELDAVFTDVRQRTEYH